MAPKGGLLGAAGDIIGGGGSGDDDKTVTEIITTTVETTQTTTTTSATTDTTTTTLTTTAEASTETGTSATTVTAAPYPYPYPYPNEQGVRTVTASDSELKETPTEQEVKVSEQASKTHARSSHGSEATRTRGSDSGNRPADGQATSTSDSDSDKAKARRELMLGRGHHDSALGEATAAASQSQVLGRALALNIDDILYDLAQGAVKNGPPGTGIEMQPTTVTLSASANTTNFNGSAAGQTAPSSSVSSHDTSSAYPESTSSRGLKNRRDYHNLPRLLTSTLAAFTTVTSLSTLHSPGARAIDVPRQLTSTALPEVLVPSSTMEKRGNPSATPSDIWVVTEAFGAYQGPSESSKLHAVRDCGIACFDETQTISTSVSVPVTPLAARDHTGTHSNAITALDKRDPIATPYGTLNVPNTISHGVPVRRHTDDHAPFGFANFGNSSNTTFATSFVGTTGGTAAFGLSGTGVFTSSVTSSNDSSSKRSDLRRRWQGNRRRVARREAEHDMRAEHDMQEAAATATVTANGEGKMPLRRGVESSFVPTSTLDVSDPLLTLVKRAPKFNLFGSKKSKTTAKKTTTPPAATPAHASSSISSKTLSGSSVPKTMASATSHHTTAASSHATSHVSEPHSTTKGFKDQLVALQPFAAAVHSAATANGVLPPSHPGQHAGVNDNNQGSIDTNGVPPNDGERPQPPSGQEILGEGGDPNGVTLNDREAPQSPSVQESPSAGDDPTGEPTNDVDAPQPPSGQQGSGGGEDDSPTTRTGSHDLADGQEGTPTSNESMPSGHEQVRGHSSADPGLQRRAKPSNTPAVNKLPSFDARLLPDPNDVEQWRQNINGVPPPDGKASQQSSGQQSAGTAMSIKSTPSTHAQATKHASTSAKLHRRGKSTPRPATKGAAVALPTQSPATSMQSSSSLTKISISSISKASSAASSGASGQGTQGAHRTSTSMTHTSGHTAASSAGGQADKGGQKSSAVSSQKSCPTPNMQIRVIK
jgi:hypothetical protein